MIAQDRMPHALLFLGPEGSGKLALAIAFARYVLCENRGEEEACKQCPACIKSSKLIHPDLHFSFPTIGTKATSNQFLAQWRSAMSQNPYLNANQWLQLIGAENKQGNINKEECVNIIRKLNLKAFESSYKILILWLPEYLGKEGNRLLKLIEEPPERTLFLLVAENQELILNTILSRCQLIKVDRLPDEQIAHALEERGLASGDRAQTLARLADGNFNEALQLADSSDNDLAQLFIDWMRKCYRGNGVEQVTWVEKFAGLGRENQKQFFQYGLHFLREYLLLKTTNKASLLRLQGDELKAAQGMLKVIELDALEDMMQLFNDCSYYIERNAHPKVLMLDCSIQLHEILKLPRSKRSRPDYLAKIKM